MALTYQLKGKTANQVAAEARRAWEDRKNPESTVAILAAERGIDLEALPDDLGRILKITPSGQGIAGVDLSVDAIVGSAAAGTVAWDLWKYVLLPHIRHLWGDKSIEEKRKAAEKAAKAEAKPKTEAKNKTKATAKAKTKATAKGKAKPKSGRKASPRKK